METQFHQSPGRPCCEKKISPNHRDQACLSHIFLDIDSEISIALIEVNLVPVWVALYQSINGTPLKSFSTKPSLLLYKFLLSFVTVLFLSKQVETRSSKWKYESCKTSWHLCINLSYSGSLQL